MNDLIKRLLQACKGTVLEQDRSSNFLDNVTLRRRIFPTPHQIAECGGPCAEGGPQACDCGLYALQQRDEPDAGSTVWHEVPSVLPSARRPAQSSPAAEALEHSACAELWLRYKQLAHALRDTSAIVQNNHARLAEEGQLTRADVSESMIPFLHRMDKHLEDLRRLKADTFRYLFTLRESLPGESSHE